MNRINPEEFLKEIDKSLELIEQDISEPGTISNIIDRNNRSMLTLLKSIVRNSQERVINDDVFQLKEKVLRLEIEVARLYREKRLRGSVSEY